MDKRFLFLLIGGLTSMQVLPVPVHGQSERKCWVPVIGNGSEVPWAGVHGDEEYHLKPINALVGHDFTAQCLPGTMIICTDRSDLVDFIRKDSVRDLCLFRAKEPGRGRILTVHIERDDEGDDVSILSITKFHISASKDS